MMDMSVYLFNAKGSIALLLEVVSERLDSLVQLSGVLGDSGLHLALGVEGSDEEVVLG